jgi:hypothetical protein
MAAMKQRRRSNTGKLDRQAERDAAAELAITALTFLAEEPERLGLFLALSGIGPESLRAAALEPNFLLGVLDHVVSNETLLMAFAEHSEIDPTDIARARDLLAGEPPHPS